MSIDTFLDAFRTFRGKFNGDWSDRLSSPVTSNLLMACSLLTSLKMYGATPLECLTPGTSPDSWAVVCYCSRERCENAVLIQGRAKGHTAVRGRSVSMGRL